MRTANQLLILTVITTIFTVPALARVEPPFPEDPTGILIGRAHPELADIDKLYVGITLFDAEPGKDGLVGKELDKLVRDRLKNAGITIAEDDIDKMKPGFKKVLRRRINEKNLRNLRWRAANIPELGIDIEMITLDDSQQYIFRIQTSLVRTVALQAQPNLHFHADVWKKASQMQTVSIQNMPPSITKVVLEQVDSFIADFRIANPPGRQPADANDIAALITAPTRQIKKPVKPTTTEHGFVASKNSKVFHKPTCSSAKRIKPGNIVTYGTRAKAAEAGKRPCKICKP